MKNTLTEINNLQGINSRVDEAKNQNSDLEYKESKMPNQNSKKKKKFKNLRIVKEPLGQFQACQHLHDGGAGRRRERKRNWKCIWENNDREHSQAGEGSRHTSSANAESQTR